MSFTFEWPTFSDDFYTSAREMLAQVSSYAVVQSSSTVSFVSVRAKMTASKQGYLNRYEDSQ